MSQMIMKFRLALQVNVRLFDHLRWRVTAAISTLDWQ